MLQFLSFCFSLDCLRTRSQELAFFSIRRYSPLNRRFPPRDGSTFPYICTFSRAWDCFLLDAGHSCVALENYACLDLVPTSVPGRCFFPPTFYLRSRACQRWRVSRCPWVLLLWVFPLLFYRMDSFYATCLYPPETLRFRITPTHCFTWFGRRHSLRSFFLPRNFPEKSGAFPPCSLDLWDLIPVTSFRILPLVPS